MAMTITPADRREYTDAGQSGERGQFGFSWRCEERSDPRVKPGGMRAITIAVHNGVEIASLRSQ
jgi:hypothetical protein